MLQLNIVINMVILDSFAFPMALDLWPVLVHVYTVLLSPGLFMRLEHALRILGEIWPSGGGSRESREPTSHCRFFGESTPLSNMELIPYLNQQSGPDSDITPPLDSTIAALVRSLLLQCAYHHGLVPPALIKRSFLDYYPR